MRSSVALLAALAVSVPLFSQSRLAPRPLSEIPTSPDAVESANQFRDHRITGRKLSKAIRKVVKELDWHRTLNHASIAAKHSGKPIVWFQVLGDLKGYT